MMNINLEIDAALCELAKATDWLNMAAQQHRDAIKNEIAAINAVNAAQKKLDNLYSTIRSMAPRGTDWNQLDDAWTETD